MVVLKAGHLTGFNRNRSWVLLQLPLMPDKPELKEGGPAVDYHPGEAPRPPVTSWQRGKRRPGLGDRLKPPKRGNPALKKFRHARP